MMFDIPLIQICFSTQVPDFKGEPETFYEAMNSSESSQ
jgi:hypothetical protein